MFELSDFMEEIDRFKLHEKSAENLYSDFKAVFDIAISKAKNSVTMSGGLRDLSEAAKSLSSIRGDAINSTNHVFASKMKVAELELKRVHAASDETDENTTALLMRSLTESIHKQNMINKKNNSPTNVDFDNTGESMLKNRISNELSNGSMKINTNEKNMKYDFSGVTYRYDSINNCMIVLNNLGNKVDDYPEERIPEEFRFKSINNGIPTDNCGREIKAYVG